jgi:4-hydroxy 2-oxovalerate aldolase
MIVGLVDFGACPAENIAPCDQSVIDGIRIAFKKEEAHSALEFGSQLKNKGYEIFMNPVSLTSYSDKEILDLLDKINELKPYAVSIVDTYGLMLRDTILYYVGLIDKNLASGISLCYHSHNNQQMAFANCCALLDRRHRRDIVVDAALFGMGKSAGNANTELVASYINKVHNGKYKIEQLLDCIYTDIIQIYKKSQWGYNLKHYISSLNDCHHGYIEFLLNKGTLSTQGINEILAQIPQEQKLAYSQTLVEKLYVAHQAISINDAECYKKLATFFNNCAILLICPGTTIKTHEVEINKYIEHYKPIVISVNFIPSKIRTNYVFTGNSNRYNKLSDSYFEIEKKPYVIATSNILESNVPITYKLNYEALVGSEFEIIDNSSALCLNFLKKLDVKQVAIAGMDGFSANLAKNFADSFMNMYNDAENSQQINSEMKRFIDSIQENITLNFITPSIFDGRE